ncbi:major facilitator superfamily domain-containing protein [Lipomyces tetrasporus]
MDGISVIFLVQLSMNFNTSLYSNGLTGISEEFGVSMQAARCGAMIFLVTYAFGCELWAPWSEELGRKSILQLSMLLVNIWQLPVALAPNFATIMVGRALGGLSLAGGSVTLGMVADMWDADTQQYAVACVVFSSVAGSVVGPLVGGFLIFGGFVQIVHLLVVPETRTTIMLGQIAKKRRKNGENVYGPYEILPWKERFSLKEICITWIRPFKMFVTEPIVLTLSLLSGFSDALIFMFIQSFRLVYDQWGFDTVALGLSFIPILVGYLIAWLSFYPVIQRNMAARRRKPDDEHAQYESRLVGPPVHWMGTMVFSAMVGIVNCSIYMTTIDYMVCAYGPYAASATGGNGFARDILAGILTIPATPFVENIGGDRHLEYASTILFCISVVLVVSVYIIYWYGPALRKRSPFAQQLSSSQMEGYSHSRRASAIMPRSKLGSRRNSLTYHQ